MHRSPSATGTADESRKEVNTMRATAALVLLAFLANADVAVFQPDGELGKDAYTSEALPGLNTGDSDTLACGFFAGGQHAVFIEFVELDDPHYENATVHSAYLALGVIGHGAGGTLRLGACTTFWDEGIIDWDNMPALVWERDVDYPVGTGWVNYDVTDIVQAWLDGTLDQHGFCLFDTGITNWFTAWSSDTPTHPDMRPQLVMSYSGAPLDQSTWGGLKGAF